MKKVEWIKVNTGIFDDQKVKLIEAMPEADAILIIWLKLLVLAGQVNDMGLIYLTKKLPYTDEMLAQIFNRKITVIRLALSTLSGLEMIEVSDTGLIEISNWTKHQNTEGLERIKEQNRLRQQRHRDKKNLKESDKKGEEKVVTLRNVNPLLSTSLSNSSSLLERLDKFSTNVIAKYQKDYTQETLTDFIDYWTEHGENDKKMRFEKEKSFGLSRRLKSWLRKEEEYQSKSKSKKTPKYKTL